MLHQPLIRGSPHMFVTGGLVRSLECHGCLVVLLCSWDQKTLCHVVVRICRMLVSLPNILLSVCRCPRLPRVTHSIQRRLYGRHSAYSTSKFRCRMVVAAECETAGRWQAPARPVHTSAYAAEFPAAQICLSLVIQDRLQQSTTPAKSSCSFLVTPCLLTS